MVTTVRASQYETLDEIVWRHYGRSSGAVEAVLAANPGLADLGVRLPHGTLITLPELETTQATANTVQLWD